MTQPTERERALSAFDEMTNGNLGDGRSYHAEIDAESIPGWVVYADVGYNGRPELGLWRWSTLIAWYRRAVRLMATDEDLDIRTAMYETYPIVKGEAA